MESVCRGELEVLLVEIGVCFGIGHGDRVVWGEVPVDFYKLCLEVGLCDFPEPWEQQCWVGYGIGCDLVSDDWEQVGSDQCVDFLDPDEISGYGVWDALDDETEFVVSCKSGWGGFPGSRVGALG